MVTVELAAAMARCGITRNSPPSVSPTLAATPGSLELATATR
jgi:hypothetical protein